MYQWHRGENATRRIQTGVTITCDGHWKAHKLQDDDGQTQTSVSWAGRPPFPRPSLPPSIRGFVSAFLPSLGRVRPVAAHLPPILRSLVAPSDQVVNGPVAAHLPPLHAWPRCRILPPTRSCTARHRNSHPICLRGPVAVSPARLVVHDPVVAHLSPFLARPVAASHR